MKIVLLALLGLIVLPFSNLKNVYADSISASPSVIPVGGTTSITLTVDNTSTVIYI